MPDANATSSAVPVPGRDLLTELLRQGAKRLLAQAVEQEINELAGARSHLKDAA